MFRMNGIARWQGQFFAPAKTALPPSVAVMPRSVYVRKLAGYCVSSIAGIAVK